MGAIIPTNYSNHKPGPADLTAASLRQMVSSNTFSKRRLHGWFAKASYQCRATFRSLSFLQIDLKPSFAILSIVIFLLNLTLYLIGRFLAPRLAPDHPYFPFLMTGFE